MASSCLENQYFKKTLIITNNKVKPAFVCQIGTNVETVCNIQSKSFKSQLKHFQKTHKIWLHPTQICYNCEHIMDSSCELVSHYKQHLLAGLTVVDQSIGTTCGGCINQQKFFTSKIPELSCSYNVE